MKRTLRAGLATRYLVDDLPGAVQVGARLHGILLKIDAGEQLTKPSQEFLTVNGLHALEALVNGRATWETFSRQGEQERADRMLASSAKAEREAAQLIEAAIAKAAAVRANFAALANDPNLRRRREARELRERYGVGYVESENYPRVLALLKRISSGQRLKAQEVAWLKVEADCWTDELHKAWHAVEARAFTKAWESGGEPWDAVNASAHWRKAGESEQALNLTEAALPGVDADLKLRSALATTRGGAMRDLGRLKDAMALAIEARKLTSRDYRPCTLLGALHMELGDLIEGHEWYARAEKLGAPRQTIDQELRTLIDRSSSKERQRILDYLLLKDPERFGRLKTSRHDHRRE